MPRTDTATPELRPGHSVFITEKILLSKLFSHATVILDALAILIIPTFQFIWIIKPQNLEKVESFCLLLACSTIWLIASYRGYRPSRTAEKYRGIYLAIKCYLATAFVLFSVILIMQQFGAIGGRAALADLCGTPFMIAGARMMTPPQANRNARQPDRGGTVIISYDRRQAHIAGAIATSMQGSRIAGMHFLNERAQIAGGYTDISILDTIDDLKKFIVSEQIGDVVFIHHPALEDLQGKAREHLLTELLAFQCRISIAVDLEGHLPGVLRNYVGRVQLVPIITEQLVTSNNSVKRWFDLIAAAAFLVLFAPVIAVLALLVRASGPGPVIFRQVRTGAQGKAFGVIKFRTMKPLSTPDFIQATDRDPRVTAIGRFLRKTSLDELPQLLNVIRGDMSLVGPRPHAPETRVEGISFEAAVRYYRIRHRVKPGITGLAQVRGQRGETRKIEILERRISSDLEYIERWSIWLDMRIILQTILAVLGRKNAY